MRGSLWLVILLKHFWWILLAPAPQYQVPPSSFSRQAVEQRGRGPAPSGLRRPEVCPSSRVQRGLPVRFTFYTHCQIVQFPFKFFKICSLQEWTFPDRQHHRNKWRTEVKWMRGLVTLKIFPYYLIMNQNILNNWHCLINILPSGGIIFIDLTFSYLEKMSTQFIHSKKYYRTKLPELPASVKVPKKLLFASDVCKKRKRISEYICRNIRTARLASLDRNDVTTRGGRPTTSKNIKIFSECCPITDMSR